MNDKLIKQIKELKGVEKVESMSDKVVVTFEATKHEAIKIQTKEQSSFIIERSSDNRPEVFERCPNDIYIEINSMNGWWQFSEKHSHKYNIISFTQYLNDYNLQDEWAEYVWKLIKEKYPVGTKFKVVHSPSEILTVSSHFKNSDFTVDIGDGVHFNITATGHEEIDGGTVYLDGVWAEIIPDELELVKGGIYYHDTETQPNIFRFKSVTKNGSFMTYSTIFIGGCTFINDSSTLRGRNPKPATDEQKRKLIKAEVKNGYFHELNIKK